MKSYGIRVRSLDDFAELVSPRFVRIGGCVFVKRLYKMTKGLEGERNRTRREALTNHDHVLEYFGPRAWAGWSRSRNVSRHPDFMAAWAVGQAIACAWYSKLKTDFPRERFRVYLFATRDSGPVVTFHRVRARDRNYIDASRAKHPDYVCDAVILGAKRRSR